MYSAYTIILTLEANKTKVSDKKIRMKKILMVAIESKVYDIVYGTVSTGRQVRYQPLFGPGGAYLEVSDPVGTDRKVYVLIKQ